MADEAGSSSSIATALTANNRVEILSADNGSQVVLELLPTEKHVEETEKSCLAPVKIEKCPPTSGACSLKNQFTIARKLLEKYIGDTLDIMTQTEDKDAAREAITKVLKNGDELKRLTEKLVASEEVTSKEMETFNGVMSLLEQNVGKIRYEVFDFIKSVTIERGSVVSNKRSKSSKSSRR